MITTLKTPKDFKVVTTRGKRFECPFFTLIVQPNSVGEARYGLTVSKKMGNAVARNRIKRRYRALIIGVQDQLPAMDIVFLARRKALDANFVEMKAAFLKATQSF